MTLATEKLYIKLILMIIIILIPHKVRLGPSYDKSILLFKLFILTLTIT